MKIRFLFILLLNLSCNLINAQNDFKRSFKLNLSYLPNTTFLRSTLDTNVFELTKIGYKVGFNPSISFQTKRKNYWEFQLIGNFRKRENFIEKPLEKNDSLKYLVGSLNISNFFGFKGINHIDLLKNKKSKLRLLLTFGYMIGYEGFKSFPYTLLSYDQKFNLFRGGFGISPRIGYNITNRFYLEFVPPLVSINSELRVGKWFTNNPVTPIKLRTQPIFDLDNQISITHFKYKNFSNSYFNDLISVGFKF